MQVSVTMLGQRAKEASYQIAGMSAQTKEQILKEIIVQLKQDCAEILKQNQKDLANARDNGISDIMADRLLLTEERIYDIADAITTIIKLDDPVGMIESGGTQPNGLRITKVRVPMGVVGIIFESRPNVTVDAAVLCIKSGNVALLRGGKEAIHTNRALVASMRTALKRLGVPEDMVVLVEDTTREGAVEMMRLKGLLDVLIPRGGAGLIRSVVENATVPVIETGVGNCHVYVDESANFDMATEIIYNAKTSRPSVCNTCESVLIHRSVAAKFLPQMNARLQEKNVQLYGCEQTRALLGDCVLPATKEDYAKEYLDYALAVRVVENLDEAIAHIREYSTGHSECIVTDSLQAATQFTSRVDSAAVYVNASTRFTDGGEFGLGAEIGISTQKLHARGPMGLKELTTIKYIVEGNGQVR